MVRGFFGHKKLGAFPNRPPEIGEPFLYALTMDEIAEDKLKVFLTDIKTKGKGL